MIMGGLAFSHELRAWTKPWLPFQIAFFLLNLPCFISVASSTVNNTQFNGSSESTLYNSSDEQTSMLPNFLNRPALSSLQSPDGDIIDCVPIRQQPAFDHPSLKDHQIKEFPSSRPQKNSSLNGTPENNIKQVWNQEGIECPVGTVPIRRTSDSDLHRVESFGRKFNAGPAMPTTNDLSFGSHDHAIGFVSGGRYKGAKATINVWQPKVGDPEEFSVSQMWIIGGSFNNELNTIEAGWQVSPDLYGDTRPRLFTYWTSDGYQQTGCYNLLCSGFVQKSNRIALGGAIAPISAYGGSQYDIHILIWKDPIHGDWWMEFEDNILVGYWPSSLFTHLRGDASLIEWGGEVVNNEPGGHHTTTWMGSGHFSSEGFRRASYFRNLEFVDGQNNLRPVSGLRTISNKPSCYDIRQYFNSNWGNYFYYGGPGRNPRCP